MFEPEVEDLRTGLSKTVRRRARIHGRQVAQDSELSDFRATYSLFVNMVQSAFRLAGQAELAKRMTLTQPSRRTTTVSDDGTPGDGTPASGTPVDVGQTDVVRAIELLISCPPGPAGPFSWDVGFLEGSFPPGLPYIPYVDVEARGQPI